MNRDRPGGLPGAIPLPVTAGLVGQRGRPWRRSQCQGRRIWRIISSFAKETWSSRGAEHRSIKRHLRPWLDCQPASITTRRARHRFDRILNNDPNHGPPPWRSGPTSPTPRAAHVCCPETRAATNVPGTRSSAVVETAAAQSSGQRHALGFGTEGDLVRRMASCNPDDALPLEHLVQLIDLISESFKGFDRV